MSELRKHVEKGCRKRKKKSVPEVTTKRNKEKKDNEYVYFGCNNVFTVWGYQMPVVHSDRVVVFLFFFLPSSSSLDAASRIMDEDVKIIDR